MKKIYVSPRIEINDYMTVNGLMQVPVEAKQYRYSVWDEEE